MKLEELKQMVAEEYAKYKNNILSAAIPTCSNSKFWMSIYLVQETIALRSFKHCLEKYS